MQSKDTSVTKWNYVDVAAWFQGFIPEERIKAHKIDGPALLELTKDDLEEDLGIKDGEQLEVILANIDNLKLWERKTALLDEEVSQRPQETKDFRWTSFGSMYSPGLVLMGNNDHNGEVNELGREDYSAGYLFAVLNDGNEFFRLNVMDLTNDLGRDTSLVVDPEQRWIYTSENGSNCIRKWNFDGKVLHTLQGVHGPIAIDPSTHNVWVLVQTGCVTTGTLRVYSSMHYRFSLIKEIPLVGSDIGYDAASRAMWIIGRKLTKISVVDYTELFSTDFTAWNPLSLSIDDTDPDVEGNEGCVWAVEGSCGSSGRARLAQYALDGLLKKEWFADGARDKAPTRVSKDAGRKGVWVIFSKIREDEILFIDRQGNEEERFLSADHFDGKRLDNLYLDYNGKLWVVGYTDTKGHGVTLYRFDVDKEEVEYQVQLPENTTISWMASFASIESFESDLKPTHFEKLDFRHAGLPPHRPPTVASTPASQRPCSSMSKSSSPIARQLMNANDAQVDFLLERLAQNVGQIPLTDEQLRAVFNQYDVDGNGFLSKREVKHILRSFESFGVDNAKRLSEIIDKMNMLGDGTVCFEEFAILMLKFAQQ